MTPKSLLGLGASVALPRCNYASAVFVLGHMRCGSTALSRILCGHPRISGYGEAHVRYDGQAALGVLALNQWRRGALRRGADRLFDKILHSRYDLDACRQFYDASAVFLVRSPHDTIRSIRKLFGKVPTGEYTTDEAAADYYEERMLVLGHQWQRFPAERRIGLTFAALTADPEPALAAISARLGLRPPLSNSYAAGIADFGHGAGDPLSAHRFDRIVPGAEATSLRQSSDSLSISSSRIRSLEELYLDISNLVKERE